MEIEEYKPQFSREDYDKYVRVYTNGYSFKLQFINYHNIFGFKFVTRPFDQTCLGTEGTMMVDKIYTSVNLLIKSINEYVKDKNENDPNWHPMTYDEFCLMVDIKRGTN
jgi:uncharacterized short protein YbdD (DUF466 family)